MDILDSDLENNLQFINSLYKYVSVKHPSKKVQHEGWLKTIDPITGSIILVAFSGDTTEVDHITLIMRDAYKDISVLKPVDPIIKAALQKLHAPDTSHLEIDVVGRKERLIKWIKKHLLPFRETDDGKGIVICENVTIHPPYIPDSCCSSNGRVLLMVRKMVDNLPDEDAEVKTEASDNTDSKETSG